MTHDERMKALSALHETMCEGKEKELENYFPKYILALAPIVSGEMVIVPAALLRTIYNEAFKQGIREQPYFGGGKSWNDSKFPALIKASQE